MIFNALGQEQIVDIVDIFFKDIAKKVESRDITLLLSDGAKKYVAEAGFDPIYGARPLKRALYEIVEDRLADLILEGKVVEGSVVTFDLEDSEIKVSIS